jgi:hypothetical protein
MTEGRAASILENGAPYVRFLLMKFGIVAGTVWMAATRIGMTEGGAVVQIIHLRRERSTFTRLPIIRWQILAHGIWATWRRVPDLGIADRFQKASNSKLSGFDQSDR